MNRLRKGISIYNIFGGVLFIILFAISCLQSDGSWNLKNKIIFSYSVIYYLALIIFGFLFLKNRSNYKILFILNLCQLLVLSSYELKYASTNGFAFVIYLSDTFDLNFYFNLFPEFHVIQNNIKNGSFIGINMTCLITLYCLLLFRKR